MYAQRTLLLSQMTLHFLRCRASFRCVYFCTQVLARGGASTNRSTSFSDGQTTPAAASVAEQERSAVRAMLRRLLAEDVAAQAGANTAQTVLPQATASQAITIAGPGLPGAES